MPLDILNTMYVMGPDALPGWQYIKQYGPPMVVAGILKYYFRGSTNTWDRTLHGKVFIVTGGTSGVGAEVVKDLAKRGAQLILLTSQLEETAGSSAHLWVSEYIDDLRNQTDNFMIYGEPCDLSSLHSVRKFATKWIDNNTPRRLDGIICIASECSPMGKTRESSIDGVELQTAVNYLGHVHLLKLLEPALKSQPADRDVRVLVTSCITQSTGEIDPDDILWNKRKYPSNRPWRVYGTSKLLLNMFAKEYQRRLENYVRSDKAPCNVRINVINPGVIRSPSTRRFLSMGSLFGLLLYLILYPIWWLFLKSCVQGAQSFLYAIYCPLLMDIRGGNYIKECSIISKTARKELEDETLQAEIFDKTLKLIEGLEKESAIQRKKDQLKEVKTNKKGKIANAKEVKKTGKSKSKENSDGKTSDPVSVFASAFGNTNNDSLQEDFQKILNRPGNDEKNKNLRLRSLDSKFERSRASTSNKEQTKDEVAET